MYKFKFADIGEGLHEGVVGEIYKNVGDQVNEGDSLFSVETDKVTSDIPAPISGKITQVLMKLGDTIHVGDVIYHIDDGSSSDDTIVEEKKEETEEMEKAPSVVGDLEQSNDILDFSKFAPQNNNATLMNSAKNEVIAESKNNDDKYDVDLIIVGSGPGGYLSGELAGKNGLKTLVIEKESPGGVCLNVGCIPTKTLLHSAKLLHYLKQDKLFGLEVDMNNVNYNWASIIKRKSQVVKKLVFGVETLLKIPGVTLIKGEGKIIDKHTVVVSGKKYTTKNIIIATGSSPIALPLPGFDEARKKNIIINSTQALSLEKVPSSFVIVGGGVIGLEFATLYNEFGTKVTIIEGLPRIVAPCDEEISAKVSKIAKNTGINIITNAKVVGYKNGGIEYEVDGEKQFIQAEKVLESVGRRPNSMNLEKIGIKLGKRKEIIVDEHMRTSIDNIFAIGDVIAHAMLAHVAYRHGKIAINSIIGIEDKYNPLFMPASIYTYPEISMIGYTEQELKKQDKKEGIDYLKVKIPNAILGKSLADGSTVGFTKLLFGKKYGEILGCHMINSSSSDIISEMSAIMELEGTIFDMNKIVHPHPSISETLAEAALKAVFVWKKANNK